MRPGDFILVHRRGPVPAMIRTGQRLRRAQRPWAAYSHAALIVSEDGGLIEALTHGVVRSHIRDYRQIPHVHVRSGLCEHDRAQALAFAESCVGQRYGFLTDLGIALRFLTPGRGLWFGMNGTSICSGMVAQALCRGWANFPSDPASMTPAELAAYYHAPRTQPPGGMLPTTDQIRRYLTLTVLPVLAGAAANWLLVHVHLLAAFHLTKGTVAAGLTQLGVFAIGAGLAFLASHHILKGSYKRAGAFEHLLGEAALEAKPLLGETITPPPSPVTVNVHPPATSEQAPVSAPANTTTA